MSPITHLLASWIVAAKTTNNPRDCRLVTFAGLLPDADGLGLIVDVARNVINHTEGFPYYGHFHHWYMHGIVGALLTAGILAALARQRWRVLLLSVAVFHLHLLCDLLGSRGPTTADLWPIYYLGPISLHGMFLWTGQWRLDGWQNRVITLVLFFVALWMASSRTDSIVGVFNRRADRAVTGVLRKWRQAWFPPKQSG